MGLDACVYCDCFEQGRLLEPPPFGVVLEVGPDGCVTGNVDGLPLEQQIAFDVWHDSRACEHRRGELLHHRLGNIGLISVLRAALSRFPEDYPVMLQKVIHSGSHTGDWLPVEDFAELERELAKLRSYRSRRSSMLSKVQERWPWFGQRFPWRFCSTATDEFVQVFRVQMEELLAAGRQLGKPIAF